MKAIKQLNFSIPSDLDALGNLLATFNSLKMDFIPEQDWLESQLALAEAFTNAVRHAHKNLDHGTQIEVNIQIFRNYLEIHVWDYGESFDLIGLLEVLEKMDLEARTEAIGKRGMIILRKVADSLSYERINNDRNCLYIKKNYRN